VTLDCLLNKQQYEKYIKKNISKKMDKKEIIFYRKRINNLTKTFLYTNNEVDGLLPDVKYAFDNYVKACIHSFKVSDNNDIIQSEFEITDNVEKKEYNLEMEEKKEEEKKDIDKLFARSTIKIINPTLDNFITIKNTQPKEEIILPKQKEINLNDDNLKNKGISKKKNITNIYENNKKNDV